MLATYHIAEQSRLISIHLWGFILNEDTCWKWATCSPWNQKINPGESIQRRPGTYLYSSHVLPQFWANKRGPRVRSIHVEPETLSLAWSTARDSLKEAGIAFQWVDDVKEGWLSLLFLLTPLGSQFESFQLRYFTRHGKYTRVIFFTSHQRSPPKCTQPCITSGAFCVQLLDFHLHCRSVFVRFL